ncbi:hypothetical protein [Legionella yabuuchiae]|uniref:hypothetical protein n=1 Tax=Legionella yabuuchiae TaxID=376727 RepID=UPI00105536EA|nr:hypothetical protein [Legionella yabuuchiae]
MKKIISVEHPADVFMAGADLQKHLSMLINTALETIDSNVTLLVDRSSPGFSRKQVNASNKSE